MTEETNRCAAQGRPESSMKGPGSILPALSLPRSRGVSGARAAAIVCPAVALAVALALQELDRLNALELLPTPEALLSRLRARGDDFSLIMGVAGAYLHEQGLAGAHGVR